MNNKSIFERMNNISGRGPEKWLSRSLCEDKEDFQHLEKARKDAEALNQQRMANQDASSTIPSDAPESGGTAAKQRAYFRKAIKDRDKLEKTPKGIEPKFKVKHKEMIDHPDQPMDEITGERKEVNVAGRFDGQGRQNKRPDMAGRSVQKERDEMATLEAIHAIHNLGLSGEELEERVARHFVNKDSQGGGIGDEYTDRERREAMSSAIKSAQRMIAHFNNQDGEIGIGSKAGQSTDVPDENRSSFFDDVYGQMMDDIEGRTGESPRAVLLKALFDSEEGSGNFDDNIWPADVYLTNKDKEEEMRKQFDTLHQTYLKDVDRDKISPERYYTMFAELVAQMHRNGDATGYSLKKLANDPDRLVDALSFNTNPDDPARIISSIITGDIDIPTEMKLDRDGNLKGKKGFGFKQLTQLEDNGQEVDVPAKFDAKIANKPNYYKAEPTPLAGDNARLGMVPTPQLRQMIEEITGEAIGFNTNEVPGSSPVDILKSENFSPEQMEYWGDFIDDLIQNPSETFNLGNNNFSWGGEETDGRGFMNNLLESFNLSDEEREQDDDIVQRGEHGYNRVNQRMETMSMLKNFRMMKMFRDAERDGNLPDVLGRLIALSGKVNTKDTDPFMAFTKIQSAH
tara:strand:- start:108 stop:1988 length:1881 start_codon:yes stop_codon:yes gene_type:complete